MDTWTRKFWIVNGIFLLIRLVLAASLPLSPDEAYYWTWSRHLDWSYFDHPPMVAWWMAASTAVFGSSELAVRLMAPLSVAAAAWVIFHAARRSVDAPSALRLSTALQVIPFFNLGGVILTPDTPLVLFWMLGLTAYFRARESGRLSDWFVLGLAVGLGLLSKYTMILFPACLLLAERSNLRGKTLKGLLGAGAAALLLFWPVLQWNAGREWLSFSFQWEHGTSGTGSLWENAGGFFLAQLLLFTPGFWFLFLRARKGRTRPYDYKSAAAFAWPPLIFFLPFALYTHAEAGWAAVAYPAALWLAWLGAASSDTSFTRAWRVSVLTALLLTALLYAWGLGLFGRNDVLAHGPDLVKEAASVLELLPEGAVDLPVVAETYQIASLWWYYMAADDETPGVVSPAMRRKSQFDLWPGPPRGDGFIWIARPSVDGPPPVAGRERFDCRYADEVWPGKIRAGRFVFLICLPSDRGGLGAQW